MATREISWTDRKPYPDASREKYGGTTGRPSSPGAMANVVESSHVSAPTAAEIRGRSARVPPPPGGRPERTTLPYGIEPAPSPYGSRDNVLRGGGRGPAPPTEEVLAPEPPSQSTRDDERLTPVGEPERATHPPEGPGRVTYPSLDRISAP